MGSRCAAECQCRDGKGARFRANGWSTLKHGNLQAIPGMGESELGKQRDPTCRAVTGLLPGLGSGQPHLSCRLFLFLMVESGFGTIPSSQHRSKLKTVADCGVDSSPRAPMDVFTLAVNPSRADAPALSLSSAVPIAAGPGEWRMANGEWRRVAALSSSRSTGASSCFCFRFRLARLCSDPASRRCT